MRLLFYIRKITYLALGAQLLLLPFQQTIYATPTLEQIASDVVELSDQMTQVQSGYLSPERSCAASMDFRSHEELLAESFEDLSLSIAESTDAHAATREFYQAFIDQINAQKGTSYQIDEVCERIREQVDLMEIPLSIQPYLLQGLDYLENKTPPVFTKDHFLGLSLYRLFRPWEWSCFGWNKSSYERTAHALEHDESKVLAFALFACSITLVALFAPATLTTVLSAMTAGATAML